MRAPAGRRLRPRPDALPGQAVDQGERLERAGAEQVLRRLRNPAGTARRQDGQVRVGLEDESGAADQVGARLHRGSLRHAMRRVVLLPGAQLVLTTEPLVLTTEPY